MILLRFNTNRTMVIAQRYDADIKIEDWEDFTDHPDGPNFAGRSYDSITDSFGPLPTPSPLAAAEAGGLEANLSESSGWKFVQSSATVDTNGSIVELIASTSFASVWLSFSIIHRLGISDPLAKFDILVGAAGSEVEKIVDEGYHRDGVSSGGYNSSVLFGWPFVIASGSRISIRIEDQLNTALFYSVSLSIFQGN